MNEIMTVISVTKLPLLSTLYNTVSPNNDIRNHREKDEKKNKLKSETKRKNNKSETKK